MKKVLFYLCAVACLGLQLSSCSKSNDASTTTNNAPVSNGKLSSSDAAYSDMTVKPKLNALVVNVTGLWCHVCGTSGIKGFEDAVNTDPTAINGLSLQITDALSTPVGNDLIKYFYPAKGVPSFGINEKNNGNYIPNGSSVLGLTSETSSGAVAVSFTKSGGYLNIRTKTKFYSAKTGDYKLIVLVLENNLRANQVTDAGNINMNHNYVLRAGATGYNGDAINVSGTNIAAGDEFGKTYKVKMADSWDQSNLSVLAIITQNDGSKIYEMTNSTIAW